MKEDNFDVPVFDRVADSEQVTNDVDEEQSVLLPVLLDYCDQLDVDEEKKKQEAWDSSLVLDAFAVPAEIPSLNHPPVNHEDDEDDTAEHQEPGAKEGGESIASVYVPKTSVWEEKTSLGDFVRKKEEEGILSDKNMAHRQK